MRRFLTSATLLATAASLALSGCAGEPPAASAEASRYLADSQTRAAATPTPEPTVDVAAAQAKLQAMVKGSAPLVISVLGDSTGDKKGEWVDLWAKHLAAYGTVTLHMWDDAGAGWMKETITYPGPPRAITIWNGSKPGANHMYALERLAKIQPVKPSFQILNYGHNYQAARADGGLHDLLGQLTTQWGAAVPTVVTLQNPATGAREGRSLASMTYLREWAATKYPVIDVYTPFKAAAGNNLPALLINDGVGVHPNPAGQKIWADTITKTLG